MSTRLQVVLDDAELAEIRRDAERQGMTVSAWVRRAIRTARRAESAVGPSLKLDLIRVAADHCFPTADIEVMLREIDADHLTVDE